MTEHTFSIGQVLTALTGRLLCSVDDLYAVLNYLTGESLYTHQLPRAFRVAAPHVAQQFPDLAVLDWSGVNQETWKSWLAEQEQRFGKTLTLEPLPTGAYEAQEPLSELAEMMGGIDRIIAIDPKVEGRDD